MKVIALIDGEHHPDVARDALDRLACEHEIAGVLFAGGEEKVSAEARAAPAEWFGRAVTFPGGPLRQELGELLEQTRPDAVFDLAGDPVLDWSERLRLACVALDLGAAYRAPGLAVDPPEAERLDYAGPVLAVIGTGKRTGKTAVGGHYASLLRARMVEPVVLSMGRGGPRKPQLVRAGERLDVDALRQIARQGRHAASDYIEDAVLSGASCVGARRCGEGLAGEVFDSNVREGAALALSVDPEVLIVEGSGATVPPIHAQRTVCVTSARRARADALSYLGPYRLLRSDLVVLAGAEALPTAERLELERELSEWAGEGAVIACSLEPEPSAPVRAGAQAAVFTTASPELEPQQRKALGRRGVNVSFYSSNLSRRRDLERDLDRAVREGCDAFLTELKGAAIELVAARAEQTGAEVVFLRNRPVALPGARDLDEELWRLYEEARIECASPEAAAAGGR